MGSSWSLFGRSSKFTKTDQQGEEQRMDKAVPPKAETEKLPPEPTAQLAPLDGIGQRNELLRVRFGHMIDRLDDLKTLSEDFNQMIRPLEAIVLELPHAKARVQETEALLSRELAASQELRREVDGLSSQLSASQGEVTNLLARARKFEAEILELDAVNEERRLVVIEKTHLLETAQKQLAAESDHREHLEAELAFKRAENETNEQSLQRAEGQLRRDAEQLAMYEQEVRRLNNLTNSQLDRVNSLEARNADLAQQREAHLHAISAIEVRLLDEQAVREKVDAEHEAAVALLAAERSGLALKLDAVSARLATTEQILTGVRNQLREKDEAFRSAERMLKEAAIERAAVERRLEGLRAENYHYVTQNQDGQRQRQELEDRAEMLTKALAAKDATLENATTKISSLSSRLETLTKRFENDRLSLEAANRRLVEELEGERAERTLAQGALEIARENRVSLQRQNEVLKRQARALQSQGDEGENTVQFSIDRGLDTSNVSFFSVQDKKSE
ncbi:hypothetical protein ASG54_10505 [Aureimonas sp. Leaf460]|nr:hypothetical protein [Aureimonas sp. Leaf460]KQT60555.1 hypothetical protein ASG62_07905 [Aureimonas sp. Leaf427]KQT79432.1 hypothetical protein ASG54_10505 [Aureimonas sp. Leaf460]